MNTSLADDALVLQCDVGSISLDDLSRQINAQWLTQALSQRYPAVIVETSSIIKVFAGCSAKIWVSMTFNPVGRQAGLPAVMVVKAGFNRHDPIMLFTYETETLAYRDVLSRYPINSPKCFYAGPSPDGESWALIIEDLTQRNVRFCHALTPLTASEATAFVRAFARFHAQTWNKPELKDGSWEWARQREKIMAGFSNYFAMLLAPDSWEKFVAMPRGCAVPWRWRDRDRFLAAFAKLQEFESTQAQTVLMGDEHLGNLYIEADGTPGFLDFQSRVAAWGQGLAYFIGNAIDVEERRRCDRALIQTYVDELTACGIAAPSFDEAWDAYSRELLFGFFVWLTNGTQFQTESVCTANTARYVAAMRDNDTFARLGIE